MSEGQYQEINPQGTYQGINPYAQCQSGIADRSLENALARIARALEGIEGELRSSKRGSAQGPGT
jgi:hypothetical protein